MRLACCRLDHALLQSVGAALRGLDGIHIAAAVDLSPLDAFASHDERQAAAARLYGMRTLSPGG